MIAYDLLILVHRSRNWSLSLTYIVGWDALFMRCYFEDAICGECFRCSDVYSAHIYS